MEALSFTHVPAEGYASFGQDLASDAWGAIDVTPYEGQDQTAAKPLGDAPLLISHKLRLSWALASLVHAIEGSGSAGQCSKAWGATQKQLNAQLNAGTHASDPKKREAAARLKKSLLLGAGEAQTKLGYQQEVDFGRKQLMLTASGQGADDVKLLGLGDTMTEVTTTTEALAAAIGHGKSHDRPFERLEAATAVCTAAFAAVAEQLAWVAEHGEPGADRERAAALRHPLEKLVARYPAPKNVAAKPAGGGTAKPAGGGTATPANGGTAAPANGGTAAPANGGGAAPANGGTAAPANGGSAAPVDGGAKPGGGAAPVGGEVKPGGGAAGGG